MKTINRREWLRASLLLSSMLVANPSGFARTKSSRSIVNPYTGQWLVPNSNKNTNRIRLSSNENPYGPSKKALEALQNALPEANRYPFESTEELKQLIAETHGVSPENIMLGAGSMELLITMGVAFGAREGAVLTAFPTFEPLVRVMMQLNCEWQQVNVNEKGETDLDEIEKSANLKTRLVYLVNPNNPTGTANDPEKLKAFCRSMANKVPVFIDEAYNEFQEDYSNHSMISLVKENVPITVSRTLSKIHGFAGLRIGYLIGPAPVIARLKTYRPWPTTLSGPSIAAAKVTLTDEDFITLTREKNTEARKVVVSGLKSLGIDCFDSKSNFVFFPIPVSGEDFITKMAEDNIDVAAWTYLDKSWGRVSIATPDEMNSFIKAMEKLS